MILYLQPIIDKVTKEIYKLKKEYGNDNLRLTIIHENSDKNKMKYLANIQNKCYDFEVDLSMYNLNNYNKFPYHVLQNVNVLPIRPFNYDNELIIKQNLVGWRDIDNFTGNSNFKHCTVEAVRKIIEYYELQNKSICIIGSNLGEEISKELKTINCVPIVINTRTPQELNKKYMKECDILISCTGKKDLLTIENTREGQIILNVGLTDVSKELYNKERYKVTPKKNGIGELTTLILFRHIFQ